MLTLLSLLITKAGDLRNATVYRTSGDPAFDQAATACANLSHWTPVTEKGQPVEATTIMGAQWTPGWHLQVLPVSPSGQPNYCVYPAKAVRSSEQGTVAASYTISADGTTKNFKIVQTSGTPDLDQGASDCVSNWRFFPSYANGQPVEIDRTIRFSWHLQNPPPADMPNDNMQPCKILPEEAILTGGARTALMYVYMKPDGSLQFAKMYRTSGDDDFDKAAITCANQSHWAPMLKDGKPAQVTWVMQAGWIPPWHFVIRPASPDGDTEPCFKRMPPEQIWGLFGRRPVVTVSYTIAADGRVKNATVVNSSGFENVDYASASCVSDWHFYPVLLDDGQPFETNRIVRIVWSVAPR